LESGKLPAVSNFPDMESASRSLENSLREVKAFSEKNKLGWEDRFAEAMKLLHDPHPIVPYHPDLLPPSFDGIRSRQLLAGAAKAWVFGGMGSWNDIYISEQAQEKEYQRITKNLYQSALQSIGAVTNAKGA
jgi:hypothetical protein